MTRPRIYTTEAIVLRTSSLGEADRLITLLTPGLGKLRAAARGVRKPTSKLGGHLDSLTRYANLSIIGGELLPNQVWMSVSGIGITWASRC